jgi:hypothetical protein
LNKKPKKSKRVPAGTLLDGIEVFPLDNDLTVTDAILLIKATDENGFAGWFMRRTHTISTEEALGALVAQVRLAERRLLAEFEAD